MPADDSIVLPLEQAAIIKRLLEGSEPRTRKEQKVVDDFIVVVEKAQER